MGGSGAEQLELELQDALGVHYQTAYRWVRTDRLPATLVNKKYVVLGRDVASFDARRHAPAAPPPPSGRRIDRQAERMYEALVAGEETSARKIARRLVEEGTSLVELIQSVYAPAWRRIGRAWHDGDVTIWMEHRASAIVDRSLGELVPNRRGRRRGLAMVAAVEGDHHSLPTTMAAVALRDSNWHVHHLGANMPADGLTAFCAEHNPDLAVISLTNPDTSGLARETARRIRLAGTATIVGGPSRSLEQLVDEARMSAEASP
ncbi:MAG: B12-binding domain-containing protein [Ilumatobacteraceae bacterium]